VTHTCLNDLKLMLLFLPICACTVQAHMGQEAHHVQVAHDVDSIHVNDDECAYVLPQLSTDAACNSYHAAGAWPSGLLSIACYVQRPITALHVCM